MNSQKPHDRGLLSTSVQSLATLVNVINEGEAIKEPSHHSNDLWTHEPVNIAVNNDDLANIQHKHCVNLPDGFSFGTIIPSDDLQMNKLADFLQNNQKDSDSQVAYVTYPLPYLKWLLITPDQREDLLITVKSTQTNAIVGFIAGVPQQYAICSATNSKRTTLVEVCLLTVHKKLRGKRLTSILSKKLMSVMFSMQMLQGISTVVSDRRIQSLHLSPFHVSRQYILLPLGTINQNAWKFVRPRTVDWSCICDAISSQQQHCSFYQAFTPDVAQSKWGIHSDIGGIAVLISKSRKHITHTTNAIAYHLIYEVNNGITHTIALIDQVVGLQETEEIANLMMLFAQHVQQTRGAILVIGRESLLPDSFWTKAGFIDAQRDLSAFLYNTNAEPRCVSFSLP